LAFYPLRVRIRLTRAFSRSGFPSQRVVHFPLSDGYSVQGPVAPQFSTPDTPPEPPAPAGRERILLVEDEDVVRRLACIVLTRHGYTVVDASGPSEAL